VRSLIVFLLLTVLLASLCSLASAGEPPVPIEGRLLVAGVADVVPGGPSSNPFAYMMEGSSDSITPLPLALVDVTDVSPLEDRVCSNVPYGEVSDYPYVLYDVWTSNWDGSGATNLTASLGGYNCAAQWSPDGSQIAFHHAAATGWGWPCGGAGFQVWVMNADGTDAHRVTDTDDFSTWFPQWAPNGYRLLCAAMDTVTWEEWAITVDVDGTDLAVVPNIGTTPEFSRDGSTIASSWTEPDTVGGEPGVWRQLRLTDADGSNPTSIVQHFIPQSDLDQHYTAYGQPLSMTWSAQGNLGPIWPEWSPRGDRIAFIAGMPLDPAGLWWPVQREVWVYDFGTEDLTQITSDDTAPWTLCWDGHNTFPSDPEVTVDNTTVTFSQVTGDGLTTVLRDDDPPPLPTGYEFCEEFYEISTTAQIAGPISICMSYDDAELPTGVAEADLAILHYVEDLEAWVDITTSRDPVENTVCGETDSLSLFVLYGGPRTGHFPDVSYTGYGPEGTDPHWALAQVEACFEARVVGGYPDGSYQPTWQVTRGQMAVFIARALVAPEGDEGLEGWTAPTTPSFPDVGTSFWAYKHIEYLKSLKIAGGYDDGLYRPTATVTRDQMAAYISRAIADPKGDEGLAGFTPPATPTFPDVPEDQWAYTYIEYAAANGVVQGYPHPDPDDPDATIYRYLPNVIVTRSQMAVYVARAFGLPI